MHNVRYSGLAGRQILGRTHRDHQVSPWWVSYAEGTVEERIARTMIERFKATADTAGADSVGLGTGRRVARRVLVAGRCPVRQGMTGNAKE